MSDQIKHECGIALIRLLKPLEYYTRLLNKHCKVDFVKSQHKYYIQDIIL